MPDSDAVMSEVPFVKPAEASPVLLITTILWLADDDQVTELVRI